MSEKEKTIFYYKNELDLETIKKIVDILQLFIYTHLNQIQMYVSLCM